MARRSAPLHRPRFAALALVVLSGAALSACGGSDDTSTAGTIAAASASSAAPEANDSDGGSAAKASTSDDPFCQQVALASDKFGLNAGAAAGSLDDTLSQLPEAAKLLEEASADAPAEIKPDLEVLSITLADVAPVLARVAELSATASDPANAEELKTLSGELTEKMAAISDPEFTAAIENLNAYAKEHCGIEFS